MLSGRGPSGLVPASWSVDDSVAMCSMGSAPAVLMGCGGCFGFTGSYATLVAGPGAGLGPWACGAVVLVRVCTHQASLMPVVLSWCCCLLRELRQLVVEGKWVSLSSLGPLEDGKSRCCDGHLTCWTLLGSSGVCAQASWQTSLYWGRWQASLRWSPNMLCAAGQRHLCLPRRRGTSCQGHAGHWWLARWRGKAWRRP